VRITQSRGSIPRAVATASLLSVFGCALLMAQSGPVGAFDKIKALSGEWVTKTPDGMSMTSSFRVTAAGSAVMQMLGEGTEHEMPTIYHMDGDRLMATHYCAAQNQPRMVLKPGGEKLQFEFLDITNLKSPDAGHMRRLAITILDKDHIQQEWTYREKGKDTAETFDLVRKK
jgi:hypothetical protein